MCTNSIKMGLTVLFAVLLMTCTLISEVQAAANPDSLHGSYMSIDVYNNTGTFDIRVDYPTDQDSGWLLFVGLTQDKQEYRFYKLQCNGVTYMASGVTYTLPLINDHGEHIVKLVPWSGDGQIYCASAEQIVFTPNVTHEKAYCKNPNMMVNYTSADAPVQKAAELCAGKTQDETFHVVSSYIANHFQYEVNGDESWIASATDTYSEGSGACLDLSTLACVMLRSQGVACTLNVGKVSSSEGSAEHAWVVVYLNDQGVLYDPSADILCVDTSMLQYTAFRVY